jgi:ferredoxin
MAKRKIIKIDEGKCNGCGLCIPNCPEGALKVIDGKARLISDLFCDGLGACLGHCPEGAITIEEREAGKYDEQSVMENIAKQGPNVIREHIRHLMAHNEAGYVKEAIGYLKEKKIEVPDETPQARRGRAPCGCPGAAPVDFGAKSCGPEAAAPSGASRPELRQWPVQIMLVPVNASFFNGADLLVAADCVPFAYPDFHAVLLRGKTLLVGCPKLDDLDVYKEKLSQIVKANDIRSITYAHMEVPCCSGLIGVIKQAVSASGKDIPFKDVTVGIRGELLR